MLIIFLDYLAFVVLVFDSIFLLILVNSFNCLTSVVTANDERVTQISNAEAGLKTISPFGYTFGQIKIDPRFDRRKMK